MDPKQLGPYRIVKLLGRGGMGSVYEGVDETTGQRVAVKALAAGLASEAAFRSRFVVEIETLKRLRHPNIVELVGFGEQDGLLFYSMELIEGTNLEEQMRDGRQFLWRDVVKITLEMCAALRHAHDRGIIHRDIKPANLMENKEGRVMLSDFGIAKLFGGTELTSAGGVIGTADFMSPEQASGQPVNHRTDLYSLGAVMYTLLAHRPPFVGKSLPEVLHMVRYDAPQPVSRFAFSLPNELEEIVMRLLEKDPDRRIPTALALSNRLKAMEESLAEKQRATHVDPPPPKPKREDSFILTDADSGASGSLPTMAHRPTAEASDEYQLRDDDPPLVVGAKTHGSSGNVAATIATAADAPVKQAPAPSTQAHFTTVDKAKLGRTHEAPDDEQPPWLVWGVAVLALAAVAVALFLLMRPASADHLYERIAVAAEAGELDGARGEIEQFVNRFKNDSRFAEVAAYEEELRIEGLERRLELAARKRRLSEPVSLVEAAYLDAMQLARSQPAEARRKLQALKDVFGSQEKLSTDTKLCVNLAKRQIERLSQWEEQLSEQGGKALLERLADAEALEKTSPQAARQVYQGIVELYAEQAWAAKAVEQAKAKLAP